MAEKIKISLSAVIADLEAGLNRKEIRAKYGLSATDSTRLFSHEKLKGKRVKSAQAFELEDDTAETEVKAKPAKEATAAAPKKAATAKAAETPKAEAIKEVEEEEENLDVVDDTVETATGAAIKEVETDADKDDDAAEVTSNKGAW